MSEQTVIAKTERPITLEIICEGLRRLGIKPVDILLVHSSLSSLGWVCGGAQTVISALKQVLGSKGTLVMPAHSGDWSDPGEWGNPPVPREWVEIIYNNLPAYNPAITPSRGMGTIAELFRTLPGTIRSDHPQVSFTASGKRAAEIVAGHVLTPQFGLHSPLGQLYDLDAKVLLLGVGFQSCTCFHLAEVLTGVAPSKRMGTALEENGQRNWKWFEDYDYDACDFGLLGRDFEKELKVAQEKVGLAKCRLFSLREAVDFAKPWLLLHRFPGPDDPKPNSIVR